MTTTIFISLFLSSVAFGARLDNLYLPPGSSSGSPGAYSFSSSGSGRSFGGGPQIPITRYSNDNEGTGSYSYAYETGNGISVQEQGHLKNVGGQGEAEAVTGSFSYTGPDGHQYSIQYTADENGFRPVGAHLPTPPPIPEAILKSLNNVGSGGGYDDGDDGQYRPSGDYLPPRRSGSFDSQNGYRY